MSRENYKQSKMIKKPITADQLHCPKCGTVIPKGQTRCPNPNCPTNKPIRGKLGTKI